MLPRLTFRLTSFTATKPLNSLVRSRVSRMQSSLMRRRDGTGRSSPRLRLSVTAGDRAIAGESLSAPGGLAFFEESVDAFGCVLEHHVAGHALGGERISVH